MGSEARVPYRSQVLAVNLGQSGPAPPSPPCTVGILGRFAVNRKTNRTVLSQQIFLIVMLFTQD